MNRPRLGARIMRGILTVSNAADALAEDYRHDYQEHGSRTAEEVAEIEAAAGYLRDLYGWWAARQRDR